MFLRDFIALAMNTAPNGDEYFERPIDKLLQSVLADTVTRTYLSNS